MPLTTIIEGVEKVTSLRRLAMAISSDLCMEVHLDQVLEYALSHLRSYRLQPLHLHQVTRATTLASLLYTAPSWWGYTSAKDWARVERLVCRLKHSAFLSDETPDVATLVLEFEDRLFQAIIADPNHVLQNHFPDMKQSKYNLRP